MSVSEPICCLIVDDYLMVREGLAAILTQEHDIRVVGTARNGCEALMLYRQLRPDVILMDVDMPVMNGIEATAAIRKEAPKAHILIITGERGDDDLYRAMHAGAKGYLLKDAPREQLLEAIRAVHQGQTVLAPDLRERLMHHERTSELTSRERDILHQMLHGNSNQQIANNLCIAESTVKTHLNHIYWKFGVNDRTQAVVTALRRGVVHLNSPNGI